MSGCNGGGHPAAERKACATDLPPRCNWKVGVAIKKAELREGAWGTVLWAVMLSIGLSAASLVLAWGLVRQTRPIDQLRQAFADASSNLANRLKSDHPRSWTAGCLTFYLDQ